MTREPIEAIVNDLEAEGQPITTRAVRERLGRGSLRDIQRYITKIQRDRADTAAEAPDTATAVAEAPLEDDPAAQVAQAVASLEAAQEHLATLQRELAPALNQRLMLVSAMRQGVITRSDPSWQDFDEASQQVYEATKRVEQAEEAVRAAEQAQQERQRVEAEQAFGHTEEGMALLAQMETLKHLRQAAEAQDSSKSIGYGHGLGVLMARFQAGARAYLATRQPVASAPLPSAPTSGLTVEVLRQYYLDGIGRCLPLGLTRLEEAHYPLLCQVRDVLREEHSEANSEFMAYQRDDRVSRLAWHDPGTLPMHKVQERLGQLHMALELTKNDMRTLQQRAGAAGRILAPQRRLA